MKKHRIHLLTGLLLGGIFACNPETNTPDPVDPVGAPTEVGTPQGAVVSKVIGAQGGTIATADGRIKITIPAGALTSETTISIQPVSNHAPNGVGTAYRFLPDGQVFSKPVQLKMRYTESDIEGSVPEALGVAWQKADKRWYNVTGKTHDIHKQEVTVPMLHFSDWSLFEQFHLSAEKSVLNYGESTSLRILELAPLTGTAEEPLVQKTSGANSRLKWSLVGGGTLKPSGISATYTAPRGAAQPNPVTVSVQIQFENNPAKLILVKEIFVGTGYIKLDFLGKEYVFTTVFLDDDELDFSSIAGGTPQEVFSIDFAQGRKGAFPFWHEGDNGKCRVNFEFGNGKQYDSGHEWCNGEDMIADGQVIFEEYVRGQYAKGTITGNLIDYDSECTKSGPAISGSFYVTPMVLPQK